MTDLAYWKKQAEPDENILWNLPEQKTGKIQLIGGNAQNFAGVIKFAEELATYNLKDVQLLLPDSLRTKLPPLPNIAFSASTESGSFAKSPELTTAFNSADLTFLAGDFSKNAETAAALVAALEQSDKPAVLAKDSIDVLAQDAQNLIEKPLVILASLAQLQNLLKKLYYPKMLLLSMPLLSVLETLHKFTLTYEDLTLLTFHQGKIICAKNGKIVTIDLADTFYTPITLWTSLPAKVAALALWNPNQPLEAVATATLWNPKSH